tara:strand:+ start:248 stop:736 length:489 start_codon:yes stop_codon:yes gene_type:complete
MTEQQIQLLIEMDQEVWEAYLPYLSAQMKQQITLGVFTGLTEAEIINNITAAVLSEAQVATLITTTLNNYSRSINYLMMKEAPRDTLYQYVGPIDGKTRNVCLKQGSEGPLTMDQIEKAYGKSVLTYGGGYNCRHAWESVSEVGVMKELYDPEKAKELLSGD